MSTKLSRSSASKAVQPEKVMFPGARDSYFTSQFGFTAGEGQGLPTFRAMDANGRLCEGGPTEEELGITKEMALRLYREMVQLNTLDVIMYEAQRQGRISFYMTSYGEESLIGSASSLRPEDVVFGQYREAGVLLYRGFTLREFMDQCYGSVGDSGKGRQMPVHFGSARLNFHTISSPLTTQLPQAAGAAYALKRESSEEGRVAMCYFGEGAASEGDFHAALNMAATLGCPTIFYCRNNGFAISTPSTEQYVGDGIASRGIGYGIETIRVDGNDVWAVKYATEKARKMALGDDGKGSPRPVLIEALTYRIGHHSTSDDSSAYRSKEEVEDWRRKDDPMTRLRRFLESRDWWNAEEETALRDETRKAVLSEFSQAEKRAKPPISDLFTDVYDELTPALKEQQQEMERLVREYPEYYQSVREHQGSENV
ncbi:thiamine diphosphate-binding protein [Piptocephalis cylindrospora]|uniref:2-oxoisovalerate dehydrogenase subunit alpha n=1 Tax=Piptocephalis cylindrospora TaxID=1907219 RepID=A0A4P9XYW8_9FUNG|nr:thiamine diphosphate-binding protein [Piptocephalis cylindrospora]|eukprot:RKP11646.1 thiamine diphosphate-binding protein [Piptocephalis cylindrospora]